MALENIEGEGENTCSLLMTSFNIGASANLPSTINSELDKMRKKIYQVENR